MRPGAADLAWPELQGAQVYSLLYAVSKGFFPLHVSKHGSGAPATMTEFVLLCAATVLTGSTPAVVGSKGE